MASKKKVQARKKKSSVRKAGTKPLKKKAAAKKSAKKKTAKKRTAAIKRKAAPAASVSKSEMPVLPGPPPGSVPPVEEPSQHEEAVGVVTHYYGHLGVAVVQINNGYLAAGDTVRIKGHTTDFTTAVESMEYEHRHIDRAEPGESVGIKVALPVRVHDIVYALAR